MHLVKVFSIAYINLINSVLKISDILRGNMYIFFQSVKEDSVYN